jgi:hypothetical protein
MRSKEFEATFKAIDESGDQGMVEAIVSTYSVDRQGDRIEPGAFRDSIAKWRASGDDVPVIFSHTWGDPMMHIGGADPRLLQETAKGLQAVMSLDIGENPVSKQVFGLLKKRRVKEFSFGYEVVKERRDSAGINLLQTLDLLELGPTLKGANQDTELLSVKSAVDEMRAGRVVVPTFDYLAANKSHFVSLSKLATDLADRLKARDPDWTTPIPPVLDGAAELDSWRRLIEEARTR